MRNFLIILALLLFSVGNINTFADSERILFLDSKNIVELNNTERIMHAPDKGDIVFTYDAPWERGDNGYVTVLQYENEFRMYYRGGDDMSREQTCVAFSKDGKKWERPNLGLFKFENSTENNIIWMPERKSYAESHNFFAFVDSMPNVKVDEKWKGFGLTIYPDDKGEEKRMLCTFLSPDGIHWRRQSDKPAITTGGGYDSLNIGFKDPWTGKYMCYSRVGVEGLRHIQVSSSDDFLKWSEAKALQFPAPTKTHFYTNGILPVPVYTPEDKGMYYIGMPMRFVPERKKVMGFDTDGVSDAVLITSRDGYNWDFVSREAWIRPGLDNNNWGKAHGNNTPAHGILKTGEKEWSVYWMERYGSTAPCLRKGTLRPEGFTSIRAGAEPGTAVIGGVDLRNAEILLNASTSAAGSIRVALINKDGKEIPGYGLNDCPEIFYDDIMIPVVWRNDIKKISGDPAIKNARLKIELKDADLYAIRVKK